MKLAFFIFDFLKKMCYILIPLGKVEKENK